MVTINVGYQNEFLFIQELNKKHFYELNPLLQELIEALYKHVSKNDMIIAYKYGKYAKADIVIEINGIKKGISIKCGAKNSVHLEPIPDFISFLHQYEFKEDDKLLRYLYSDGTNNNTGSKRESITEYREKHLEDISLINCELEKIKKFIIERFLIKTDIHYQISVDAFIEGVPNDFLWATKDEVVNYLMNNDCLSNSLHVSKLFLQEWNKNLNYNPKYEYCRNYIQIKWYSIFDDLVEILCIRRNN